MDNVRTVMIPMPCSVKAYTIFKEDYYTIVLNQNLSYEQNLVSYNHEMKHILSGDFEKKCNVGMIELIAHQI